LQRERNDGAGEKEGAENIDFGTREFATIDLDGNLVTYFQWRDS